ncbi:MAG TPA: hypothetical protein VJN18_25375 [Polyangiaceae bacterium]|nr:hypothetical protein [Polyangiaceae bacterium]
MPLAKSHAAEPQPDDFFTSRSGVCVYVKVHTHTFRVQFATADSQGVVTEGTAEGAEVALQLARAAVQKHQAALAVLFENVARRLT